MKWKDVPSVTSRRRIVGCRVALKGIRYWFQPYGKDGVSSLLWNLCYIGLPNYTVSHPRGLTLVNTDIQVSYLSWKLMYCTMVQALTGFLRHGGTGVPEAPNLHKLRVMKKGLTNLWGVASLTSFITRTLWGKLRSSPALIKCFSLILWLLLLYKQLQDASFS